MLLTNSGVDCQDVSAAFLAALAAPPETSPVCTLQALRKLLTFCGVIWLGGEYFCAMASPLKVGH